MFLAIAQPYEARHASRTYVIAASYLKKLLYEQHSLKPLLDQRHLW